MKRRLILPLVVAAISGWAAAADSADLTVAVASNFLTTFEALASEFERTTGHEVAFSAGSTGQLYAQIANGAPFDIFLAADSERPARLAADGVGLIDSQFTYARGRLVLWSADPGLVDADTLESLATERFRWLAIAEPEVAPYGAAARQVLERLGVWEAVESRIVRQHNVAQAFAAVATRNAEFGLVAASLMLAYDGEASSALVPANLHDPIRQDAILLRHGTGNAAATDFLEFLRGQAATAILERNGYQSPSPSEAR